MTRFRLSKWYVDAVTPDGDAFIGYWARLRWRALHVDYASALIAPTGSEPRQIHALRAPPPAQNGARCTWSCPPLGVDGCWARDAQPFRRILLRSPRGGIRWRCDQPRAVVQLRLDRAGQSGVESVEVRGLGYVERLDLTIPPWRLPFDVLLWGRFLSDTHSLVWLEWRRERGAHRSPAATRRMAVLDGARIRGPVIGDDEVRLGDVRLALHESRPLREGALATTVFGVIPGLVGLLPEAFRRAHESKRLSRGRLYLPGRSSEEGWAIHEVVRW